MANVLTTIIPKILAGMLPVLRENAVMPQLVQHYGTRSRVKPGKAIDVPISVAQTASAITNSNTPPANTDKTPTSVQITLNKHYGSNFHLSDAEVTQINSDGLHIPGQIAESIKALANQVDSDLLALYLDAQNAVGTGGTTPFASESQLATDWQQGARKFLNDGLAAPSDRSVVLDTAAEAALGSLSLFTHADERGDQEGILNGSIGRKLGASWYMNQNVPTFDSNVPTGFLVNDASHATGATTLTIDTGSGTIKVGDIFTVAGDTTRYTVTAASQTAPTISPIGKVALADNAAVTFHADHVANIAFHRDAFAIASADLGGADFGLANVRSIVDPVTGLVLRLEVRRDYKQTTWELDVLYGVQTIRGELACLIMG